MRAANYLAVLVVLAFISACAPKTAPLPVAGPAHFPEFLQPIAPGPLASSPLAAQNQRAWLFLQAGDLRGAEREMAIALKAQPNFYPAQATGAYAALARRDVKGAVAQFSKLADTHPDY